MKTKNLIKVATLCLVAFVAAFSLQSCNEVKPVPQADLEGFWKLKSLNGHAADSVFEGAVPTLVFNFTDSLVSGTGGCNGYTGKFSYEKGLFNAPNIEATRMLCTEKNLEPEFFIALANKNNKLAVANGELTFTFEDKPTLVFEKTEAPKEAVKMVADSTTMGGVWTLKTIDGADAKIKFPTALPSLVFDFAQNRVSGSDGCNNLGATFTLNNYQLILGTIISTRMACENMDAVNQFTQAIADTSIVTIPNENVLQIAKNGAVILEFEKLPTTM